MSTDVDFAILAPVPIAHLESGLAVVASEGFVAYGSRKWQLFREVDMLRGPEEVPVLIYPSWEHEVVKVNFLIKWTAIYIGRVETDDGSHPDGAKHRPASVEPYPRDWIGFWAVFWHVKDLTRLPAEELRPLSSLQSYKSGKYWKAGTPPRGPEIVARPSWI